MAKFELPIYGENDEILKTYQTDHIKWDTMCKSATLADEMEEMTEAEAINVIGEFLLSVFIGLTEDELKKADCQDVVNTFNQIVRLGNRIKGGNSKN